MCGGVFFFFFFFSWRRALRMLVERQFGLVLSMKGSLLTRVALRECGPDR